MSCNLNGIESRIQDPILMADGNLDPDRSLPEQYAQSKRTIEVLLFAADTGINPLFAGEEDLKYLNEDIRKALGERAALYLRDRKVQDPTLRLIQSPVEESDTSYREISGDRIAS